MPMYGATIKRAGETALDLGVYMPLGAAVRAKELFLSRDKLANEYRSLVDRGRRTLDPLLGRQQQRLEQVKVDAQERGRQARDSVRGQAHEVRSRAQDARQQTKAATRGVAGRELPIARYDDLTAQEVIAELSGLTQEELAQVRAYERRNEDRSTVLQAIEPRLVRLPIGGYDEMTADEIVKKLADLSPEQLRTIRDYENKTRARTTIIERIEALIAA
jgi:hypothetical protein